jgi:hypothetical protein
MTQPPPSPPSPERWYLPSWPERLRLMKWRLIYFLPALLLLPLVLLAPFLVFFWWKLLLIAVGIPITAAINAARHSVRLRREPFCIHCGYDLTGLPDGHICPECGVQFHLSEIDDYRRDPHWFIQRRSLNRELPPSGAVIEAGPRRSPKSRDGT